jgi:hypothetical protein
MERLGYCHTPSPVRGAVERPVEVPVGLCQREIAGTGGQLGLGEVDDRDGGNGPFEEPWFDGSPQCEVLLGVGGAEARHERAPVGLEPEEAERGEPLQRLADRDLADTEPVRQFILAELGSGPKLTAQHQADHFFMDPIDRRHVQIVYDYSIHCIAEGATP